MRDRRFDPALAAAIAAAACWLATMLDLWGGALRVPAAVLLVLVLPGYAVVEAAVPAGGIGSWERVVLAVGLSAASAALGGLALHLTPWGLHPWTWGPLLVAITVGAGAVAVWRRPLPALAARRPLARPGGLTPQDSLFFGTAAIIVAVAWMAARTGAAQTPGAEYTQLWMMPAAIDGRPAVRLGVRSAERRPLTYRLELQTGGVPVRAWAVIALQPGEQWETIEPLPASELQAMVGATLYRADQTGIYRHVTLWPASWLSSPVAMHGGG